MNCGTPDGKVFHSGAVHPPFVSLKFSSEAEGSILLKFLSKIFFLFGKTGNAKRDRSERGQKTASRGLGGR